MSEPKFLKANCQQCGGHIEFPAEGLGMTVVCPHCQLKTTLKVAGAPVPVTPHSTPTSKAATAPVPPASPTVSETRAPSAGSASPERIPAVPKASPPRPMPTASAAPIAPQEPKSRIGLLIAIGLAVLALGAIGYVGYTKFMGEKVQAEAAPLAPRSPKPKKNPGTTVTNSETRAVAEAAPKPAASKSSKSPGDLQSGDVILEKSKGGSSLVYAVATITNNSDHQRFGVKVEVDIFDLKGKKIGKATDYIQLIEPRNKWRFHALVLEDTAASAKIASIKEEE